MDAPEESFSRREREIMNIIYRLGNATASEVLEQLDEPPSYSAVRATLRILEGKGHLHHVQEGSSYVFRPVVDATKARTNALQHLLNTFFDGSVEKVVAALVDNPRRGLTDTDLDRLSDLIEHARKEGR